MTAPLYVANGENAGDPQSRSGSAHYLTVALGARGRDALPLKMASLRSSPIRLVAASARLGIRLSQIQAMYFTAPGQSIKWQENRKLTGDFIDFCQVSPPRSDFRRNSRIFKYIDTPLEELFRYPEYDYLGGPLRERLIEEEGRSYRAADAIFTYSHWCKQLIVARHDLAPDKVHVARSGANLPSGALDQARRAQGGDILRLLFVGKDHQRKGLAFLSRVAEEIQACGTAVEITVVGPEVSEVPAHPNLRPIGYLSKTGDLSSYIELINNCHFGVLWSSAEGLPNSLLECLSMGRPIISNDLPQVQQELGVGASVILDGSIDPHSMAEIISELWNSPARIGALLDRAYEERANFTWTSAADLMIDVMSNSNESAPKRAR